MIHIRFHWSWLMYFAVAVPTFAWQSHRAHPYDWPDILIMVGYVTAGVLLGLPKNGNPKK